MTLATGYGSGDCGFPFRVGESCAWFMQRVAGRRALARASVRARGWQGRPPTTSHTRDRSHGQYDVTASAPAGYHRRHPDARDSRLTRRRRLDAPHQLRQSRPRPRRRQPRRRRRERVARACSSERPQPRLAPTFHGARVDRTGRTFELELVSPGEYVLLSGVPRRQFCPALSTPGPLSGFPSGWASACTSAT